MSDSKAGNIEAIRDWSKRYFYTKSDVGEFFTKLNSGLSAYSLTIVGPANTQITITDDDQTNPQEYVITTNTNGTYQSLFFFNEGSILTLTDGTHYGSHTLTDYVDYIELDKTISSLIPDMTSDTTPSGVVLHANLESESYAVWRAFNSTIGRASQYPDLDGNTGLGYMGYDFGTPVYIRKISENRTNPGELANGLLYYVEYSNDGTNWYKAATITSTTDMNVETSFYEENPHRYWRLAAYTGGGNGRARNSTCLFETYLQFWGYTV